MKDMQGEEIKVGDIVLWHGFDAGSILPTDNGVFTVDSIGTVGIVVKKMRPLKNNNSRGIPVLEHTCNYNIQVIL